MSYISKKFLSPIIYGAVDGLITTNSIISSVQGANLNPFNSIIFGFANLFADGFSMGVSSYLSSDSIEEGIATFIAFILIGSAPILPFIFSLTVFSKDNNYKLSHIITTVTLFIVGLIKGYIKKENMLKHALIVTVIGGATTIIAYYISKEIKNRFEDNVQ
jgi:VIT1/CCC1 family predicted Fe2+/Mn2+ transporter